MGHLASALWRITAVISSEIWLQAVLFYVPTLVWHGLNSKAGVDADSILAAAHTFSRTDRVENRDRTLKMLVNQMDRFLRSRRQARRVNCGRTYVKLKPYLLTSVLNIYTVNRKKAAVHL